MNKYQGFISYAHEDNEDIKVAETFIKNFKKFAKNQNIDTWYDKDLCVGQDWFQEIQNAVLECHFGLFLVSESFISSSFIKQYEFDKLIDLLSHNHVNVFPVLLKHTNLESEKVIQDWRELLKKQIFKFNNQNYHIECMIQNSGVFIHNPNKDHYLEKLVNEIKTQMSNYKINSNESKLSQDTSSQNHTIISHSVEKTFNKANKLLDILYPWKELKDEEHGNIKYEYWQCGKKDDPYYYLILFPSTSAPVKAIEKFVDKILNKQIPRPRNLLTILKNSNIYKSTLKSFTDNSINSKFYTYKDYYWQECIPEHIKNFKNEIEDDEYYIEQYLYDYYDDLNQEAIGTVSDIVLDYVEKDSSRPVLALIAQAGIGKTTFIEHIIKRIDSKKQLQCIYISSEEIKEKTSSIRSLPNIETIYDLYEYSGDKRKLDDQRLSMGITNGSIVILIDGLEEIISYFRSEKKFNSEMFFNSLVSINNELGQCKVIVTSRELTESNNDFLKREEILVYKLKGFGDKLVKEYLEKRFDPKSRVMSKESSEMHIKKVNKYLLKISQKIQNDNKVIPYILDLICESVEEEFIDNKEDLSFELHDEYLSNHDVIDNIVYSYFFERELTRQSYPEEFTPKDLAYIFIGFAVELGTIFSKEKMIEIIEMKYATQYKLIFSNIEKSPLLKKVKGDAFKFKYDFLINYFICLFLIQDFAGKDTDFEVSKTLSKLPSEIIDDFKKFFQGSNTSLFMKNVKRIHKNFIIKFKSNEELYKNAISNLVLLLIKVNSESLSAEKNTKLIQELYTEKGILRRLYIFNKFVPLDFKNLEILESEFRGFTSFFSSKFDKTSFISCTFQNMKEGYDNEQIWNDIKFDTCELGDLKELIDKDDSKQYVKKVILKVLRHISTGKYNFTEKEAKYIECLINNDFIKKVGIQYKLERKGKQFLKNGTITIKTNQLFKCVLEKS